MRNPKRLKRRGKIANDGLLKSMKIHRRRGGHDPARRSRGISECRRQQRRSLAATAGAAASVSRATVALAAATLATTVDAAASVSPATVALAAALAALALAAALAAALVLWQRFKPPLVDVQLCWTVCFSPFSHFVL